MEVHQVAPTFILLCCRKEEHPFLWTEGEWETIESKPEERIMIRIVKDATLGTLSLAKSIVQMIEEVYHFLKSSIGLDCKGRTNIKMFSILPVSLWL